MRSPELKMEGKCQADKDKPHQDLRRFHEWAESERGCASVGLQQATASGERA